MKSTDVLAQRQAAIEWNEVDCPLHVETNRRIDERYEKEWRE
jgi:hypothetical protein